MINSIRNIFRTNPYLFIFWYKVYRSRKGVKLKWFNENTDLYFDGYPRSGNTFMLHLMRGIYDDKNMIHHFHTVSSLKIAFKKNIKSIILIRNPNDSISSYYLKRFEKSSLPETINVKLLQMLVNDYVIYYKYVHKNLNKLHLVEFTKLVNEPEDTLLFVNQYLDNYSEIKDKEIFQNIIRERKSMQFGAKSKLGSSLPSKEKEKLKLEIKNVIRSLDRFIVANNLFINLTK